MLEKVQRRLSTNFCTNPRSSVSKAAAKCPTGISRQYRLKKLLGYSRQVRTISFITVFFVHICLLEGLPQPWWAYQHATGTGCRWDLTRKANLASERGLLGFYCSGNRRKCTCSSEAFLTCNNFARCVDANSSGVKLIFCPEGSVSGPWAYDEDSQMLLHRRGNRYWITKNCLIIHSSKQRWQIWFCRCLAVRGDSLALMKCDPQQESHKWVFKDNKPSWATWLSFMNFEHKIGQQISL